MGMKIVVGDGKIMIEYIDYFNGVDVEVGEIWVGVFLVIIGLMVDG